jgi:UDP-glucose 4-epimerase
MDAHVLVTGGAGFIGSHSVDALLAAGARVRVLDDFSTGKPDNLPASHPRLEVIEGDIRDPAAVAGALAGATHVLHLAAQIFVQVSIREPVESCHTNVVGFLNVMDGARRAGLRRMVYASSAAVYGTPVQLPLDEESRAAPLSPYGLEKSIDDQYAALYGKLYGFSAMGMRYFNVYGPRQDPASPYSGVISKWSDALRAGRPLRIFGDGQQTRDFIYVKDIARYNVLALQHDAGGVCNIGSGRSVTLLALIDALESAAGLRAQRQFEPPAAGDIQASAMAPQRLNALFGAQAATPLLDGLRALLHA